MPIASQFSTFIDALLLQAGHNAAVVSLGAAALGAGAGAIGVFILLRKRALISDAISHATLPGVCLAFLLGAWLWGDGRYLPVLLIGAAASGAFGVVLVQAITARTRLTEDVAIGAVLSVFFAAGIVLLTIIQSLNVGGQAGLQGFLLGSAAAMLSHEALLIVAAASITAAIVVVLEKEFTLVCFDAEFARAVGYDVAWIDLLMVGLLLAIVVIGLSTVGLVLIIALAIIPPVAARFWTDRAHRMMLISAAIGAAGCYVGAALSASAGSVPTGAIIVVVLFALFVVSLVVSPVRGVVAALIRHIRFQRLVHERQGLLALARTEPVFDSLTRRILHRRGYIHRDGALTDAGAAAAARAVHDQALWARYATDYPDEARHLEGWSVRPIDDVLPRDLIAELEQRVRPVAVGSAPVRG